MAMDPAKGPDLEPRADEPLREPLKGLTPADAAERALEPGEVTRAPDGAPPEAQPAWRQDFPIDWPRDTYVARRDFAKFLVLTSGAFVAGQGWIAAQHLLREKRPAPPRVKIASIAQIAVGASLVFRYPGEDDRCLLVRPDDKTLVAYSQACTHLSCAVVPRVSEGVIFCPCHEGYFDLATGRNIAGPPPRPLPKILLEVVGEDVYAVGVETRTV
jgi:Rieske Fe-S protein